MEKFKRKYQLSIDTVLGVVTNSSDEDYAYNYAYIGGREELVRKIINTYVPKSELRALEDFIVEQVSSIYDCFNGCLERNQGYCQGVYVKEYTRVLRPYKKLKNLLQKHTDVPKDVYDELEKILVLDVSNQVDIHSIILDKYSDKTKKFLEDYSAKSHRPFNQAVMFDFYEHGENTGFKKFEEIYNKDPEKVWDEVGRTVTITYTANSETPELDKFLETISYRFDYAEDY